MFAQRGLFFDEHSSFRLQDRDRGRSDTQREVGFHQCPCYPLIWKLLRFNARGQLPLLFLIQLYRLGKSVFWRLMGAQAGSPTPQLCSSGSDLGIATRIFLGSLLGKQELGSHPTLLSRDLGLGGCQGFLSEALLRKQPIRASDSSVATVWACVPLPCRSFTARIWKEHILFFCLFVYICVCMCVSKAVPAKNPKQYR